VCDGDNRIFTVAMAKSSKYILDVLQAYIATDNYFVPAILKVVI